MLHSQLRLLLIIAASQTLLAVIAGAFGAHILKQLVPINQLNWWDTGIQYLMYHSLACLFIAWCSQKIPALRYCVLFFTLGNILFAGSLMLMAVTGNKALGAITPIGGILYILGWAYLIQCFIKLDIK